MAKEHPLYEISCTYEFLEDTFTDWGPSIFDCMDLSTQQRQQMINPISGYSYKEEKPSLLKRIGKLPLPGYVKKQSEIKRNHPLKFMVCVSHFVFQLGRMKPDHYGERSSLTYLGGSCFMLALPSIKPSIATVRVSKSTLN